MAVSDYMTIVDVAKLLGKGETTIKRWCAQKKLSAEKIDNEWRIDRASVYQYISSPSSPSKQKSQSQVTDIPTTHELDEDDLPLPEAERLLKIEKFRKEKRINDQAEGNLIPIDQYRDNITDIFADSWEMIREFIDQWMVRGGIDARTAKAMREDFDGRLCDLLRRQKSKAMELVEA